MGWNYLQTDDRDDYFSQGHKPKKAKTHYTHYTISKNNVIVLEGDSMECRIAIKKLLKITERFCKYGRWKQEAINRGYQIKEELKILKNE